MVLHNVTLLDTCTRSIRIAGERIVAILADNQEQNYPDELQLSFQDCIVFPGLINSHDHLDFNLFPQLGHRLYENYLDWGPDIQQRDKELIQSILNIPKELRVQWGLLKNLVSGVTTVVNHEKEVVVHGSPISVFSRCHSLHSVRLEKNWKYRLNRPSIDKWPFVIHIGEGTNKAAHDEISELIRWNMLHRKIVGVHGVAMTAAQAKNFMALVWCPDSNFFLLGKTAAVDRLKSETTILFGTDSTVSANWNIWHHLRLARGTGMMSNDELIAALTTAPAAIWGLGDTGRLAENCYADVVIAKKKNNQAAVKDLFFELNPEDLLLVLSKGSIVLFDQSLLHQLNSASLEEYSKICVNDATKYVRGEWQDLIKKIKALQPDLALPIEAK